MRLSILSTILVSWFCFLLPNITKANSLLVWQDSPAPQAPYGDWDSAAHTIQDAVDAAQPGDTVLVTNGTYSVGGRAVVGTMTNRLAIDRPVIVASVSGPDVTVIQGAAAPNGGNGDGAIRCVYVGTNAWLNGFTLTQGHTRTDGDSFLEQSGGAASCEDSGALINCVITGNACGLDGAGLYGGNAYDCKISGNTGTYGAGAAHCNLFDCEVSYNSAAWGGGVVGVNMHGGSLVWNNATYAGGAWYSTLESCKLISNWSGGSGGGASQSTLKKCWLAYNSSHTGGGASESILYNCVVTRNSALVGGGTSFGTLYNCTVVFNTAEEAGGVSWGQVSNSIVYYNAGIDGANFDTGAFWHSCVIPDLYPDFDRFNVTNEPGFLNAEAGDFHLKYGSPCIDAGDDLTWFLTDDFDGNSRPIDGLLNGQPRFDIGAYEYNPSTTDSDGDRATDWQEHVADTSPTNASSFFHIESISASPPTLEFQSSSNRAYTLFACTDLPANETEAAVWMPVQGQTNVAGTGGLMRLADTNAGPQRFYRISVSFR